MPSATTPLAPNPVAGDSPPDVVTLVKPVEMMTPPRLATRPFAPAPCVAKVFVPLRLVCEPEPLTTSACASCPEVATELPLRLVTPPFAVMTPSEPAPEASTATLESVTVPPPMYEVPEPVPLNTA